jgi:hypothetical protein
MGTTDPARGRRRPKPWLVAARVLLLSLAAPIRAVDDRTKGVRWDNNA